MKRIATITWRSDTATCARYGCEPIAGRFMPRCRSSAGAAACRVPRRIDHHGGSLSAGQGAQGRPQRRRQIPITVYSGEQRGRPRSADLPVVPSIGYTPPPRTANTWFPLPQLRRCAATGPDWRGRPAPRRADKPQPPDAREGLSELLARCRCDAAEAAVLVAN